MRLLEAILDANHRAVAGDASAGLHPAEFASELPIVALTCIDARLNPLFPETLGIPKESFIWLRNAGNIITGPMSSTMRSLALACAVKGGREIVIIGHNDCLVCKTSMLKLTDAFKALGIPRSQLPENLTEFFGLFASERQNVIKGAEFVRQSPLIGSQIPVHGLMVDIGTGKLEWVVNGYQTLTGVSAIKMEMGKIGEESVNLFNSMADFKIGEMKFPEVKIGELTTEIKGKLAEEVRKVEAAVIPAQKTPPATPPVPPKIPLPLPIRPGYKMRNR